MEQREADAETKALGLIQEFIKKFRSIDFTLHPSDIPDEAAGKGSNVAWAARKLSAKYSMEVRKNVIITGIDGKWASWSVLQMACNGINPKDSRPCKRKLTRGPTSS